METLTIFFTPSVLYTKKVISLNFFFFFLYINIIFFYIDVVATKKFFYKNFGFKLWDFFSEFDSDDNELTMRVSTVPNL